MHKLQFKQRQSSGITDNPNRGLSNNTIFSFKTVSRSQAYSDRPCLHNSRLAVQSQHFLVFNPLFLSDVAHSSSASSFQLLISVFRLGKRQISIDIFSFRKGTKQILNIFSHLYYFAHKPKFCLIF